MSWNTLFIELSQICFNTKRNLSIHSQQDSILNSWTGKANGSKESIKENQKQPWWRRPWSCCLQAWHTPQAHIEFSLRMTHVLLLLWAMRIVIDKICFYFPHGPQSFQRGNVCIFFSAYVWGSIQAAGDFFKHGCHMQVCAILANSDLQMPRIWAPNGLKALPVHNACQGTWCQMWAKLVSIFVYLWPSTGST